MKIIKRNNASTLEEVIEANTGMMLEELLTERDYKLENTDKFAAILKKHKKVAVCGDYDVDGVTSTYIMVCLLKALKKEVFYRFPGRFSEGFGLSTTAVDDVLANDCTLVITVDNGITANDAVAYAKEKGLTVIITDHHLSDEVLPDADLIINPTALPETADFDGYCGAGIAYKIAGTLIRNKRFLEQCCVIAAIGTVADSVPLVKDNRQIVKMGLELIRAGKANAGITALIKKMQIDPAYFSADDIGFRIAPALNSPGRLLDNGAEIAFHMLASTETNCEQRAEEIVLFNEQRKELQEDAILRINESIKNSGIHFPLIVEAEVHEGVIGIVAGQLAEKYHIPAIVLTKTDEGYKGSGRKPKGYDDLNMKLMLDDYAGMFVRHGGHAAAAGLTVKEDSLSAFIEKIQKKYAGYPIPEEVCYYDLAVTEEDLADFVKESEKYAPYGEGNPAPVVLVEGFTLVPDREGRFARPIGAKGNILRFSGINGMSAMAFNGSVERFEELGCPDTIKAVGTVGYNHWNGWTFVQMVLSSFDKAPDDYLSLAALVKQKIRSLRNTVDPVKEMTEQAENHE